MYSPGTQGPRSRGAAENLSRKCRQLKKITAALVEAASSNNFDQLEERISDVLGLREDIDHEARKLQQACRDAGTDERDDIRVMPSFRMAMQELRETQVLFEAAAESVKCALGKTGEEISSLRSARRALKGYGSALEQSNR